MNTEPPFPLLYPAMPELNARRFDGIDYDFRPPSYWVRDEDTLEALLRNVKGTNRRRMIRDYWKMGMIAELHEELLGSDLDGKNLSVLGGFHPSFMGGEYLPDYRKNEVEIARVELESTTFDVISLRARPAKGRGIGYRIVDEYENWFEHAPKTTRRTLTLERLIRLIDGVNHGEGGGLALIPSVGQADPICGLTLEELRYFTTVWSAFYPDLSRHYEQIYDLWVGGIKSDADRPRISS